MDVPTTSDLDMNEWYVIIIADAGMDEKTRKTAEILTRDSDSVLLCRIDEIPMIIGADHWTTT